LKRNGIHLVAQNKKARHDFEILSTFEAGMVLTGTEIKSIREGRVQLKDGFGRIERGEAFLQDVYIAPYPNAGPFFNHEPTRRRKLLLHRREIQRLAGKIQEKGLAFIPLRVYLKGGKAKVEMALAKGMRKYEKREVLRKHDAQREIERAFRKR
jgi:SsrA-binding protein